MIRSTVITTAALAGLALLGAGVANADPASYTPKNKAPTAPADNYDVTPFNEAGQPTIRLTSSQTQVVANLTRGLPKTKLNIGGVSVPPTIVAYYTDQVAQQGDPASCSQLELSPAGATDAPGTTSALYDLQWAGRDCRP